MRCAQFLLQFERRVQCFTGCDARDERLARIANPRAPDADVPTLRVTVDAFPDVSPNLVQVFTVTEGLAPEEIEAVRQQFHLDPDRFLVTQVSRFDRFKDPVGVIRACDLVRRHVPGLQLVLAGGTATDDPEGAEVLREVQEAAGDDPDTRILLLPADANLTINALQRASDLVLQKSTREGFGLTVTEGLWKGKPVIGGNVGGIRLQVHDHHTGFLVDTPEGAAVRMRYLLAHDRVRVRMGERARELVRENFLLTRHVSEYLALFHTLLEGRSERVEVA